MLVVVKMTSWATRILALNLGKSLASGGPQLLSLQDCLPKVMGVPLKFQLTPCTNTPVKWNTRFGKVLHLLTRPNISVPVRCGMCVVPAWGLCCWATGRPWLRHCSSWCECYPSVELSRTIVARNKTGPNLLCCSVMLSGNGHHMLFSFHGISEDRLNPSGWGWFQEGFTLFLLVALTWRGDILIPFLLTCLFYFLIVLLSHFSLKLTCQVQKDNMSWQGRGWWVEF